MIFSLIDRPNFIPNRDLFDNTDEGPVVKLGVDLDFYNGDIFIKPKHVKQLGEVIGMVDGEEHQKALARIVELETELAELTISPEVAEKIRELYSLAHVGTPHYLPSLSDVPVVEPEGESELPENDNGDNGENGSDEPESPKPEPKPSGRAKRNGVPADSGNGPKSADSEFNLDEYNFD